MKLFSNILMAAVIVFLISCKQENPQFTEKIIDDNAPEFLWMKTYGDINGDRKIDILVGGWQKGGAVAYLAPNWEKTILNDSLKFSTDGEVRDINNDKSADLVAVVDKAIVWFENPDWKLHLIDSIVGHDIEVCDLDDDGLMDVVVRNQGEFGDVGGHTLFFYHQKPLGTWTKYQKEILDGEGLKIGDINNDKKMDVVTNGYWFENTGDIARWIEHKFTDTWNWPNTAIDIADMNNDNLPDILHSPSELAGNNYRISWFEGSKEPSSIWKEHIVLDSVETVIHSIGAADFDLDGKMDIIIAEMQQGADPDNVSIFYNQGGNKWETQVISTGGSHSMRLYDFDEDGDVDVLGANWRENIVKMWVNEKK